MGRLRVARGRDGFPLDLHPLFTQRGASTPLTHDQSLRATSDVSPQSPQPLSSADALLLDFLREHEVPCPVCRYNLKALTRPICPECGHSLRLTVGAGQVPLGWLLAALAPGFFSGIAAVFLLIPILARLFIGDGKTSWALNCLDLFGLTSGIAAVLLAMKRRRFLALPRSNQRWLTFCCWGIHLAALFLMIFLGPRYL